MNISIKFNKFTKDNALELDELYNLLNEEDINSKLIKKHLENTGGKAIDVATAINVANLALTSMSTLITVLSYFQEQKKYTISLKYENELITLDKVLNKEQNIFNNQNTDTIEFLLS